LYSISKENAKKVVILEKQFMQVVENLLKDENSGQKDAYFCYREKKHWAKDYSTKKV
jgi:hypothetical protein